MAQALYLKWRPRRWDEVVGQQHVIQTLRNAVIGNRVAHAYLFAGPRGTGKTTSARLLAKAVNCLHDDPQQRPCDACEHCVAVNEGRFLDLIEIDAASNTSVDDVRSLREKINFAPSQGKFKVYIIDEVHMLSTAAFNALLKTLEEPPAHAIFILATTEIHKIPATVLSRCQRYEFRRIPQQEMVTYLQKLAQSENLPVEPAALALVARQSTGCLRDAISLLDQLASSGETVSLAAAQSVLGTSSTQAVVALLEAILNEQPGIGLEQLHNTLDSGADPRQFARQVVDYLRALLLVQSGNAAEVDTPQDLRLEMARQAGQLTRADLLRMIRAFNQAASEARLSWQPALPLELALMEALPVTNEALPAAVPRETRALEKRAQPERRARAQDVPSPGEEDAPPQVLVASQGGELFQKITSQWKRLVKLARETDSTVANPASGLLNSGKPLRVRGNVLVIGYPSDVLRDRMADPEYTRVAEQALAALLGQGMRVECVISTASRKELPPDVDGSGMVATAVRDLGGEIVDMN
ncbi:MAG: DNA polymerase III subunit gamma/tau [Anaerolineales bacterium]